MSQQGVTIGSLALTTIYLLQRAMDDPAFRERALDVMGDALAQAMERIPNKSMRVSTLDAYAWCMCLTGQERAKLEDRYLGAELATIWLARPAYKPSRALDNLEYEYIPHGGPLPMPWSGHYPSNARPCACIHGEDSALIAWEDLPTKGVAWGVCPCTLWPACPAYKPDLVQVLEDIECPAHKPGYAIEGIEYEPITMGSTHSADSEDVAHEGSE